MGVHGKERERERLECLVYLRILPVLLVFSEKTQFMFAELYEVVQIIFSCGSLFFPLLQLVYLVDFFRV